MSNVSLIETTFPLHPAQQDVFIDQLINMDSPQYNIGGYIVLKGNLHKNILHEVVNTSPAVFDAFKMRFDANTPELVGYMDETYTTFELSEKDFSKEQDATGTALQWMQGRMNQPFTLHKKECLFEQALLKIAADEHWLFGRFHHLVMDGYGFTIWMKYMADKYRSLNTSSTQIFSFPSYIEEAVTVNSSTDETAVADDSYWKQRVHNRPAPLFHGKNIVSLNEAPASGYTYRLTATEREKLESLAQNLKAGIHQITIAALLIYFGKTTDAKNIIFGLPVHKRNSRKLRSIIGLFNSFIPFAGEYKAEQTVADLIRSVVTAQSADYRHQHFNIGNLARHLQLNTAEQNLWEVVINYLPFNLELDFGNELDASVYRMVNEYGRIPLQVCWNDYGKQQPLELQLLFLKKYFDEAEIKLFANRLLHILSQFSENVNKPVKEIAVLPLAELVMLEKFGQKTTVETIYQQPIPFSNYLVQVRTADEEFAGIGVNGKLCLLALNEEKLPASLNIIHTGITVRWTPEGELIKSEENDEQLNYTENHLPKPLSVSISATFVAEMLEEYLDYWSGEFELNLSVHFTPYNQVFQQLLHAESLLHSGEGINVVLLRTEDWIRDQLSSSVEEQISLLQTTCEQFISAVQEARKLSAKPCLLGIVPWILNTGLDPQVQDAIKEVGEKLRLHLAATPLWYELDLSKAIELYEVQEIFDRAADEAGHIPFTDECFAAIGTYISRRIRAWKSPAYKVIALDCDNTLWKGICGEVGPANVIIDANYQYLQQFFIQKHAEGFLLVLCSKNNEEDVWEVFDHHPAMKLRREHIIAHKIDWQPKPANLQAIATELNLGIESFIFIDDNPFETEQMEMACPGVLSLALPEDETGIPALLDHTWAFDLFHITEEDRQRNSMYRAEKQRETAGALFSTVNDFIVTLGVEVETRKLSEKDLERAVQLSLRTNQFNLNGIRKSYEEVAGLIADNDGINWIIEVSDKFGAYGITGLVLAKKAQNELVLHTFLLSCRVLGRNVEDKVLVALINYCTENGLDTIRAMFQASGKNKPFIEFINRTNWIADAKDNAYCYAIGHSGKKLPFTP